MRAKLFLRLALPLSLIFFALSDACAEAPSAPVAAAVHDEPLRATVAKNSVHLRMAPDVHSTAAKIMLNKGDLLVVRRSANPEWLQIQLPPPFRGLFVRQDMVTFDSKTGE